MSAFYHIMDHFMTLTSSEDFLSVLLFLLRLNFLGRPFLTRLEIQADSAGVDLRSRCPFFYEFGCKIAPVVGDRTIGFLLLSAFKSRYKEILTKAHSVAFAAGSKFWSILTKEEINLYETAQSEMASFKKWRMGGPRFQIASVLGKKRKSTE
ncbi:uncharacterized protein LOC106757408 isoform X2 [Vigna radiata var. radiata]|uniref:Uncharacterized protein LOC106757408 isoform X2 n=1 Tax=Vigna radiata var. radiata TaxID=3916 RepID=A0A1S3TP86_VIGRR|nr:uncharacterized protein LOC106757408 isoform X2 [Vigna radiata var. radiata]